MTTSVLFVGESPPAGAPADFRPFDCASGTRLASILGLRDRQTLLDHVPMRNLFDTPTGVKQGTPGWDEEAARRAVCHLVLGCNDLTSFVCLGRRVADAFNIPTANISGPPAPAILSTWRRGVFHQHVTYAPHPSGSSPRTNTPQVKTDVRQALLPELVLGCSALRPWHFRLDDPDVLHDLAVAVAPRCPAVGAAALLWACEQHSARVARLSVPLLERTAAATSYTNAPVEQWDYPLRSMSMLLLEHEGPRHLASTWSRSSSLQRTAADKWLLKRAEAHGHHADTASRAVVRATVARYMIGGLT